MTFCYSVIRHCNYLMSSCHLRTGFLLGGKGLIKKCRESICASCMFWGWVPDGLIVKSSLGWNRFCHWWRKTSNDSFDVCAQKCVKHCNGGIASCTILVGILCMEIWQFIYLQFYLDFLCTGDASGSSLCFWLLANMFPLDFAFFLSWFVVWTVALTSQQ